jgi:hypothetical protein
METRKFVIVLLTVIAVCVAIIVGTRTFSNAGKYNASEGQKAIEQAVRSESRGVTAPPGGSPPQGVILRLPGNKGRR